VVGEDGGRRGGGGGEEGGEGEVKGKLEKGVDSQYSSHYLVKWCIQHHYR